MGTWWMKSIGTQSLNEQRDFSSVVTRVVYPIFDRAMVMEGIQLDAIQ